jgi:hypothetical protein
MIYAATVPTIYARGSHLRVGDTTNLGEIIREVLPLDNGGVRYLIDGWFIYAGGPEPEYRARHFPLR